MGAETGSFKSIFLSSSPDDRSDTAITTPRTPEFHHVGLAGVMTPTPPPSGKGHVQFAGCRTASTTSNALPPTSGLDRPANIWPSLPTRSTNSLLHLAQASHLSHIWSNRQTTPPHQPTKPPIWDPDQTMTIAAMPPFRNYGQTTPSLSHQPEMHSDWDRQTPPPQNIVWERQSTPPNLRTVQPVWDLPPDRIMPNNILPLARVVPLNAQAHWRHHRIQDIRGAVDTTPTLGVDILRISHQPPPTTGFTPMHAVIAPPHPQQQRPMSARFSTRYHGMHTDANASAEHLPPEQNCALWLTNLPPNVTASQLLSCIRRVGRIYCSFINYPDFLTHHTAAAKIVFFSPAATRQFLSDSWTKGLYVGAHRVRAAHNRIKSESREAELATPKSRVLIITGCAEYVNEAFLGKYFKDRFIFQTDRVTELISAGGRTVLEWRFGSYRCQAQMGKMSLEKDRPYWLEKVEFGEDPCEVGDTYSSYGIAAERIQGRGF